MYNPLGQMSVALIQHAPSQGCDVERDRSQVFVKAKGEEDGIRRWEKDEERGYRRTVHIVNLQTRAG